MSEVTHNQEYRVSFSVGGVGYSISVYLPPGYPDERPLLQVSPPVKHPWVDAGQQVVAAPGIVNVSTERPAVQPTAATDRGYRWVVSTGLWCRPTLAGGIWSYYFC